MLYSKEQIKEIIPYQDPFLWVDEIESIEEDVIIGFKNTSVDDEYFKGHFVGFPIMPGVLVVEGIAQTGTLLLREKLGKDHKKKHLLAYQVRSALFYEPIWPGDRIKYKVKLLGIYNSKIANFLGEAFVDDGKKCEVRFSVAVVDKSEMEDKKKEAANATKDNIVKSIKLPSLKIGNIFTKLPIIQGGMAVRVSLHKLAGNVAKEGGIGIIAVSGMRDTEEVKSEIRKAREISGNNGAIGINIMGVVGRFKELVTAAVEEKIDLIIQGAGFRKDIFDIICLNGAGEKIIVEIQKYHTNFFPKRAEYIADFPILEKGENETYFNQFEKIYCLGILNFNFIDYGDDPNKNNVLHEIKLRNPKGKVFYDKLTYIYLEMPNFKKTENELVTRLDKWLYFIKNLEDFQSIPEIFKNEVVFLEAFGKAEIAKFNQTEMSVYQGNLKILRDWYAVTKYATDEAERKGMERGMERGIEMGIQQGKEEGKQEGINQGLSLVAKNLKESGMDTDLIVKATGLSAEVINQL